MNRKLHHSPKGFATDRRGFIKGGLSAIAGCTSLGAASWLGAKSLDTRYLFIVAAPGGANMTDCFLAHNKGPGAYSYDLLLEPQFTPFNCVIPRYNTVGWSLPIGNGYSQMSFLESHHQNMAVIAHEAKTLDRGAAARQVMTGNGVNNGRTLAEHIAAAYRGRYTLPNVSMATTDFAAPGTDPYLNDSARAELIADPLMFAFATHGFAGLSHQPSAAKVQLERQLRLSLEKNSKFYQENSSHPTVTRYLYNREVIMTSLEKNRLMMNLLIDGSADERYRRHGLKMSAEMATLRRQFSQLGSDPFEAQMALAFLLAKRGLTNVVTVAPGTNVVLSADGKSANTAPMGFNWSHTDHRGGQNSMWSYVLKNVDGLIQLLKGTDVDGDPANGKMWDKSVIYITSDFGRDRVSQGGSERHTNNAHLIVSPLVNGNRVYGSFDENTGLIGGFNPSTGEPESWRKITAADHYSIVADLMGAPFAGQRSFPCLKKA